MPFFSFCGETHKQIAYTRTRAAKKNYSCFASNTAWLVRRWKWCLK